MIQEVDLLGRGGQKQKQTKSGFIYPARYCSWASQGLPTLLFNVSY